MLEKIAREYTPPDNNNKARQNKQKQTNKTKQNECPENLFDVLPFRETDLSEEEYKPYIVTTYLPDGIYHKMKRNCEKAGVKLITKPGTKLKNILCTYNKTHHDKNKKPGVYKLACPCSDKSVYVGQTIRPIEMRAKEHCRAAEKGNWSHSGISQHKEKCNEVVNWEPEIVVNTMSNKNKKKLAYDLKVRESFKMLYWSIC